MLGWHGPWQKKKKIPFRQRGAFPWSARTQWPATNSPWRLHLCLSDGSPRAPGSVVTVFLKPEVLFHYLYLPVVPPILPSWSRGGVGTCPFALFLSVTCYCRCLLWIVSVKSDKHSAVVIYIRETAMCRKEFSSVDDLHFEGTGRRGQGPNFTYSLSPWLGGTVNNLQRESITVLIYHKSVGSSLRSSAMCPHCSFKCFDNRIINNLAHFSTVKPCKLLNCGCIIVTMLVTDLPL